MSMLSSGSRFYDSEPTLVCQVCHLADSNLGNLPCKHSMCESCLTKLLDTAGKTPNHSIIKCPVCDKMATRSKALKKKKKSNVKQDKGSVFYTPSTMAVSPSVSANGGNEIREDNSQKTSLSASLPSVQSSQDPILRRSAHSHPKSRSAMIFLAAPTNFESKISTDSKDCLYWGGDVTASGEVILADWYNSTLKVFTMNGEFITILKYFLPPLGVTALSGDQVVVSFGSAQSSVCFVAYKKRRLFQTSEISLPGYMFTTVGYKHGCLGIFQHKHRSVKCSLMVIREDQSMTSLDIGDISKHLLTESGLAYGQQRDHIYFTCKRKLFCVKPDGRLVFEKVFHNNTGFDESTDKSSTDGAYPLSAIATDVNGDLFIASDQCVLKVSPDKDLIQVIQTAVDPYHVMCSKGGNSVIVVGKDSTVELLPALSSKETFSAC